MSLHPIKNLSTNLTTANSPLEIYSETNVAGTVYLEGALKSGQAVKLRLSQGKEGESWLSQEDFDFSADVGEAFSLAVTCRSVKLELVRVSADATVQYELNNRSGGE